MLRLQGLHPVWLQDVHWEYFMHSIMALEGQQTWLPLLAHSDPRHPNHCNKNRRVTPATITVECSGLGGGDLHLAQPWHVCIRTNKHKQQVYGPSLALLEESVRTSDQSTIHFTGLGLTKSLQEFLVLHYYATDSASSWFDLLSDWFPHYDSHLCPIPGSADMPTRGHSRDRSLMHPCYVLINAEDYWAFNQRPHGLMELVLGDRDLSFPWILPQMINFPIIQAFLAPLVPGGFACVTMNVWHNGAALDFRLVDCFDGFFVQVTVCCVRTLMDNILTAAPIVTPQIHIDLLVLPDPQVLQVTAFVPGGDTLISSRSVAVVDRRDRVYVVLHTVLRQRFPDMLHVGFEILTVHPSSKWLDPTFGPQKEKVVIVYTDEFLRRNAAVLLRLSFPPYDEEGAIYITRRLRLRTLVRQLGLSPLCGHDGENCLCFVNGIELANEIDAAVEDAAFIYCWMLPLGIADSASVPSLEVLADDQGAGDVLTCPPQGGSPSTAAM